MATFNTLFDREIQHWNRARLIEEMKRLERTIANDKTPQILWETSVEKFDLCSARLEVVPT